MNHNLVYVVGLGPGDAQLLTAQARAALQSAEVLCGYTVYVELVRPLFPEKEVYATGMTREIDRCRWALETAQRGKTVALVCSGDAGVYGMASPLLELAAQYPGVLRGQFQQRAGHTVDPRITGADQRHGFAALRGFQRPAAAVNLPRHAGGVDLLFREKRPHQLHIDRVAAQHLGALQRGAGLRGQKLRVTGAKAHHIDKVMVHFSISNPGQRTARPRRRSRRPAPISEGTAPRPRPAPPHAHRHCPRR